jgi:hypothetical protein
VGIFPGKGLLHRKGKEQVCKNKKIYMHVHVYVDIFIYIYSLGEVYP